MKIAGVEIGAARPERGDVMRREQSRFVAGDGTPKVRDTEDFTEDIVTFVIPRATDAQKTAFDNVIKGASVNFAEKQVVITEDDATTFNGHIWSKSISRQRRLGLFWQLKFAVRKS